MKKERRASPVALLPAGGEKVAEGRMRGYSRCDEASLLSELIPRAAHDAELRVAQRDFDALESPLAARVA